MSIRSVVGQDRVSDMLRLMITSERVPPGVLLVGPVGSGKTAAAMLLARALLCTGERDAAPCGACDNCNRSAGFSHPDLFVTMPLKGGDPSEDEKRGRAEEAVRDPYGFQLPEPSDNIGIDRIRDLINEFAKASFQGRGRVAVILRAHQMRVEGANSMLKTLEEPPPKSTLILTAPSLDALLPTIVSRCQVLRLGPASVSGLATYLREQRGLTQDNADYVAAVSGGNVREALTVASDEAHQTQDRALKFLNALLDGREAQTFVALEQLASEKGDVFDVLKSAEVWLRDILQFRVAGAERVVNRHRLSDVEQLADKMTDETILVLAEQIERVRAMNHRNINLQLSLTELWRKARATAPIGSI